MADAEADWVLRVLGIQVPAMAREAERIAPTWMDARFAWTDANDAVDEQIGTLREAILARADIEPEYGPFLSQIADKGLNAITENYRVKLMAAVMDVGTGSAVAVSKSGPKALEQITAFRTFIDGSEKIAVCDANPFGVKVAIRGTLVPALDAMASALKAALAAAP
ncbi:MAG TPA: hypothetical protein VGH36_11895 [Acetobacteraceae bacterium]|jgi:hypothetical protein